MSLASTARQALGRFTHLSSNRQPASAKSTPAKADDKDEKASDDDKDKEKAEDGDEKCDDEDDKEKADDGDKDKNPVDEKAADDDEDEDDDKDKKKEAKKAARVATQAERSRWTTVLGHKNSAGRIEAACELLADKNANHTAESIVRILGTLPAIEAGKTGGLGTRMSAVTIPKVGADSSAAPDPTTPAGLAAQIVANQDRARGIKRAS